MMDGVMASLCPACAAPMSVGHRCLAARSAEPTLPPGTALGEYQVTETLGAGGMGVVYAAVHPLIGKKVAIKVLNERFSHSSTIVERFVQEARAVNRIGHRNIVDIFAFGEAPDGRPFFVMEYIPGADLRARLRADPPLTYGDALSILDQVLDALEAAHDAGVVHRDLKPDNIILVETRGHRAVKLLDFGVAKLLNQGPGGEKTSTGLTIGTPSFMSPEQCLCQPVDARSDLYSLGVIMFVLFTGTRPFSGSSEFVVLQGHVHRAPPRPRSVADLPIALEEVILYCLEKRPDKRPQSASELRQRLGKVRVLLSSEALAQSLPSQMGRDPAARPPMATPSSANDFSALPPPEAASPPGRASKTGMLVGALVLALLLGGVYVGARATPSHPTAAALSAAREAPELALQIVSDPPGAQVSIGGKQRTLLTPNVYRVPLSARIAVRIELDGYLPFVEQVQIEAGATERAVRAKLVPLKPIPAQVEVRVNARRADFMVDSRSAGNGSNQLQLEVSPGVHWITAAAPGFVARKEQISVVSGQRIALAWELLAAPRAGGGTAAPPAASKPASKPDLDALGGWGR